jgi:terpene synthase-like protein
VTSTIADNMKLNSIVVNEIVTWGQGLDGFERSYAVDGVTMAQGYVEGVLGDGGQAVPGIGPERGCERPMFVMALDLAWLLWLDDRFERHARSAELTDWRALHGATTGLPTTVEGEAFYRVRTRMAQEAPRVADYQLWLDSALSVFDAYRENQLLTRGERTWGYAEHLANGETSIALAHFLATVSLAYDYRFVDRVADSQYMRTVRSLAIATRLQNDLVSVDKERRDGERANAVLVLEELLGFEKACAFVRAERQSHERLLARDLAALPPHDPLVPLARIILAATEHYYRVAHSRYGAAP